MNRLIKKPFLNRTLEQRFWPKVKKTETCWIWTGATTFSGYGVIDKINGRSRLRAHRVSWELHNGPIPKGLMVLHHCDNRPCVNPEHLHLGSHPENMADRMAHGIMLRGEKNPLAKLTEQIVLAIRRDYVPRQAGCHDCAPGAGPYPGSVAFLAKKYDVPRRTVQHIVKGTRWKYLTLSPELDHAETV